MPPNREPLYAIAHVDSDALTIAMAGELDIARENELLNLVATLDPPLGSVIELDVSELTFVDSTGLRSIVSTQAYVQGRRCELRLVRPQPHLLKLVELLGIADVFTVVDGPLELVENDEAVPSG